MAKKDRVPVPDAVATLLMFGSDRTCCVCRQRGEPIQIHHIDEDPRFLEADSVKLFCRVTDPSPESVVDATLTRISTGRRNAPVLGSGILVGGYGDDGGRVEVDELTTGEIHSNGMIPSGTSNLIAAGVFVLNGAHVKSIQNTQTVTTYGVNDMVLDAWGSVDHWLTEKALTSYGPSGIGFVNFGTVGTFEAKEKIETFGLGALGFNQYEGTIERASFDSIITHGDGAVGIQIAKPIGMLEVRKSLITSGSVGKTLYKGRITELPATGVSIKEGSEVRELILANGISTHGDNVQSLEVDGKIGRFVVSGEIVAPGKGSVGVKIGRKGEVALDGISIKTEPGKAVERDE